MLSIAEAFPNKIAGILSSGDSQKVFRVAIAAVDGGVGTIEITTTVPDWAEVIRGLDASTGGFPVGAGTVINAEIFTTAKDAGAKFVIRTGLELLRRLRSARAGPAGGDLASPFQTLLSIGSQLPPTTYEEVQEAGLPLRS